MHFTRSLAFLASVALVNAVPVPQDAGADTGAAPGAASSSSSAAAPSTTASGNSTSVAIKLVSESDFCLFLPPQPGLEVATNEDNGIPFCSNGSNDVPGAKNFPQGFITVAHFQQNDTYQQVTGYMDPSAYQLSSTDQGGQYDNHGNGKPVGASCQGYSYFVSIIEPADSRFCIRCCQSTEDCNTGTSQDGCLQVVPGDYTQADGTQPGASASGDPSASGAAQPSSTDTSSTPDDSSAAAPATNNNEAIHPNTDFGSVLDELPNQAASSDAGSTDPSSGDNTTSTQDPSSSGSDSSSGSGPIANEIPTELTSLQTMVNNGTSPQEIQQSFQQFLQEVQTKYPNLVQPLQQLGGMTSQFTTTDEWKNFIQTIQNKLNGAGGALPSSLPSDFASASMSDVSLPTGVSSAASSGASDISHANAWVSEDDVSHSNDVESDALSASLPVGGSSASASASAFSSAPSANASTGSSQPITSEQLDQELDDRFNTFEEKLVDELRNLVGGDNSAESHNNQAQW
ncbi:hypothetical protein INT43_001047 [Umbelopsis isabellina]|uniref:Uncharacterized protein n=1 Tax=Mortierella isabellina TaxID=91625 RepID=A0A8H7UA73_MORIS|nr:hypothetical protein INT43_001047 [Umbelopsis isabellina]